MSKNKTYVEAGANAIDIPDLRMQCFDGRLCKPLRFWAPVKIHSATHMPIRTLDGSYIYALPGGGSIKG